MNEVIRKWDKVCEIIVVKYWIIGSLRLIIEKKINSASFEVILVVCLELFFC